MAEALLPKKTMRDAFLQQVLASLDGGADIFFLSADFGAPAIDAIRERHSSRFLNVGIAEQNLINLASGLGLEGLTVYAYAIAPFITMRCFEQIRVNLAILSQLRPMNVNLIGVGAGFSYDVSGPTHHCLEDLSIMRTLPNCEVFSPCDWTTAAALMPYTLQTSGVKYLRFDAKPHHGFYSEISAAQIAQGFVELKTGRDVCLVSTGYLTAQASAAVGQLEAQGLSVGHVDMIKVKGFAADSLMAKLKTYKKVITLEEGFVGKGGLDAAIGSLLLELERPPRFKALGLADRYIFHIGSRESLHAQNHLDIASILHAATA